MAPQLQLADWHCSCSDLVSYCTGLQLLAPRIALHADREHIGTLSASIIATHTCTVRVVVDNQGTNCRVQCRWPRTAHAYQYNQVALIGISSGQAMQASKLQFSWVERLVLPRTVDPPAADDDDWSSWRAEAMVPSMFELMPDADEPAARHSKAQSTRLADDALAMMKRWIVVRCVS